MATTLRRDGDTMRLKLGGLDKDAFQDALQKAKAVPGRRYDSDTKEWVYDLTTDNAMRLVHTIKVEADPEIQQMIRDHVAAIAGDLAARVNDDAELPVPWADRLYPYQRAGADFIRQNRTVLMADDMGLGKTVQSTSAVMADYGPGARGLVIAPNSLKLNWGRSIEYGPRYKGTPLFPEWTPGEVTIIDAPTLERRKRQLSGAEHWVVVNWEVFRTDLAPLLEERDWDAIIADEVHRAKNYKKRVSRKRDSALSQAERFRRTRNADMRVGLTGTPILNDPSDLWSPLHWLDPESYGSYWWFFHTYVYYYEGNYGRVITGVRNPDALRSALRTTLVRRTKGQVLKDLPAKLPPDEREIELYPVQRKLYKQAEKELWLEVEEVLSDPELAESVAPKFRERVLRAIEAQDFQTLEHLLPNGGSRITRMRQVISTPALVGGEDKSAKLDAVQDIVLDHPDEQFVVYTWFKGTADIMARRLRKLLKDDNAARAVHGDTPDGEKDEAFEAFQRGDVRVLVATIRTGGEGHDLYAARFAIFVERDWVPAYNRQALDRLHRIGQDRRVQAIYLDAADTLDVGKVVPTNRLKELIEASVLGAESQPEE